MAFVTLMKLAVCCLMNCHFWVLIIGIGGIRSYKHNALVSRQYWTSKTLSRIEGNPNYLYLPAKSRIHIVTVKLNFLINVLSQLPSMDDCFFKILVVNVFKLSCWPKASVISMFSYGVLVASCRFCFQHWIINRGAQKRCAGATVKAIKPIYISTEVTNVPAQNRNAYKMAH